MNYKELGLKCGLEIHQQLEGKKLFCACPTVIRDDEADFSIQRKLRAAAGEEGKVDIAAKQEQMKSRTFTYRGYNDTTCLVEADCEPPHAVNQEALYTALQLCTLAGTNIFPIVQVMRKTIVDGSNTSGFQRTALLAKDGIIKTSVGEVRISNVSLEEDSCKIVSETAEEKAYSLDRLGIPLIEIGTAPDITTPEQCQEAAKKLGMLLRSLPGVKRGLGTIRQDVNVSIKGGARIEIKGAQDLRQLPLLVELEVKRQQELLKIREELKKVTLPALHIIEVSSLFVHSAANVIKNTLAKKGKILGVKLPGLTGYIGREVQPGRRIGTEFSDWAKVRAGVGGIFHSDELPRYGISEQEVVSVKKQLGCAEKDAFVLVADEERKARLALEAVHQRAQELLKGIPAEVRKANADGTTTYLRPIPGAARMYPETDVPLIKPDVKNIELPETLEEKMERFHVTLGLGKDLAEFAAKSDKVGLFEELVQEYPAIKPAFIAETLISTPLDIKRQFHHDPDKLTEDNFRDLFRYLTEGKIHKDIVLDVLIDIITDKFDIKRYATLGTEEIHKELLKIVAENKGAPFSALMGLAMKRLAGKASGQFISSELHKIVEKGH
ncbi:MAG TPA: Glu-tRNA(Gln) amidotransferase subunit GatE [Candidatus Nanoarchaeia archaeon]|nr:Glu-tRNA(Gln) amidotransferase subunit GatE [Candidatus Nanoarchaeia archaeon]